MKRLATPLLATAIYLLNVWLNWPLFVPGELPFRGSIEGSYVGMARFLSQHPNPWGWNPLQYCGLPAQFMYVPVIPYAGALGIRLLPHVSPDFIYRSMAAFLTCAGPVTAFLFALYFTRSRRWAFAAAVAYSLFSPSYGLFPAVEKDRGIVQLPWRIQVLAKYGEGPHNVGLTLLPLAILALWRSSFKRSFPSLFLAAVVLAVIPLTNWIAGFSLAISAGLLLLAAWGQAAFSYGRTLAAAVLAYLLACFWLTPSFIRTIAFNWPVDSFAYQFHAKQAWLTAGAAAGAIIIRLLFRYFRGSFYFCFVTMAAFVFGWIATAFYVGGIDTIPESRRYAIEFELFLMLALVEGLRLALRSGNATVRMSAMGAGGVMLLMGVPQLWAYLTQSQARWMPSPPETTIEYRLADWIRQQHPRGRVFASGGLRFRLNSWFDIPQVGGGFESGLRNRTPVDLAYRIRIGADDSAELLRQLGAEYVVVHGPKSREYYRDFHHPERISGLPVVYHGEDDSIYQLPPVPLPYRLEWQGSSAFTITGAVQPGQPVNVPVNADPGWRAWQEGRPIEISGDGLGFMAVHAEPAASTRIDLRYIGTAEQRVFAGISTITWLAAVFWLFRGRYTKTQNRDRSLSVAAQRGLRLKSAGWNGKRPWRSTVSE